MPADEIITIRDLHKSYGDTKAVDGLTLGVARGDFKGFLGPNGAGKTTTIRILTGIIPSDRGEITIAGLDDAKRLEIARMLGVVPESRGFYGWMNAEEYLSFFAALYAIDGAEAQARVSNLLGKVGLTSYRNKRIAEYSRGMKQRLGLARALINNPSILILDEPTLGLDPRGQKDIHSLLRDLNAGGVTVFYSSHVLNEVAELCNTVAIINHGRMVAEGSVADLLHSTRRESLTDLFLSLTDDENN
jgi:ABC-2 type transport system ATP-binding protein